MKKGITIAIIILVALGFGYFLFKISPQQDQQTSGGYNALMDTANVKPLPVPPAFDPSKDHYQGSAKAKNVFIEYGDMQCPACAAYSPILNQVAKEFTDTVFVYRYFPLVQIHKNAVESAMAAEAAGAQGKYWEMHDILFAKQSDWENLTEPLDTFADYAKSVGVSNINQFKSDITNKKFTAIIQKGFTDSLSLNLQGTPSLFFNGHPLQLGGDINGLKKQAEPFLNK